jgi:hypothetical protein
MVVIMVQEFERLCKEAIAVHFKMLCVPLEGIWKTKNSLRQDIQFSGRG